MTETKSSLCQYRLRRRNTVTLGRLLRYHSCMYIPNGTYYARSLKRQQWKSYQPV